MWFGFKNHFLLKGKETMATELEVSVDLVENPGLGRRVGRNC